MPRGAWIVGAIGFIVIAAAVLWQHQPRDPIASKTLLESLLADGKPHPAGTPEGVAFAERAAKALEQAGVKVELQRTEVAGPGGHPLKLVNVLGRLKGKGPGPATLVTAHHDSVSAGPGAGDDGAGVVTVIETARTLAREITQRDVIFLLTDGEEKGLYGAVAFVAEHPWFNDVGAVVNLDARGASGPCHVYELGFGQRDLVALMQSSLPRPVTSSVADEVYRRMPSGSDFTVYRRVGLPGFNLAFIGGVEHYHQASDVAANLDAGTLAHMQESALALVRALDGAPPLPNGVPSTLAEVRARISIGDPTAMRELRQADLGTKPEPSAQSFASLGQRWVLSFDAELAPWFAGAVLFVFVLACTLAWWRESLMCSAWRGGIGRVLVLACATGGAAAAVAVGVSLWGQLDGRGWYQGVWPVPAWPWMTAVWAAAFAAGSALWQLIPRRNAFASVAAACTVLVVVLAGTSAAQPSTAATLLPVAAVTTIALFLASLLPIGAARYAAAFVACIQLWALTAVLMPLEPALIDAFGFGSGVVPVVARPLLVAIAFCVLLPGERFTDPLAPQAPTSRNVLTEWRPAPLSIEAAKSSSIATPLALDLNAGPGSANASDRSMSEPSSTPRGDSEPTTKSQWRP